MQELLAAGAGKDEVEEAVGMLVKAGEEQMNQVNDKTLEESIVGRWKLKFSTEGPLRNIIERGLFPFGKTHNVYQLFGEGGRVEVR